MTAEQVYFVNHGVGKKWPFTIYHQPIEDFILAQSKTIKSGADCLNIGCGFFDSYPSLKPAGKWHACDIDARCIEVVEKRFPEVPGRVCSHLRDFQPGSFDFIISTEVIEHITDPLPWLRDVFRISRPGAKIILSTPNYGVSLLPVIEYSLLEVLARLRGFSRFGIHPNKYNRKKFYKQLKATAPEGSKIEITTCSYGMVLIGVVELPKLNG